MNLTPSPTGTSHIPQWLITAGIVVVTATGAVLPFLSEGPWKTGAMVVIALGSAFGIASQGKRS